MKSVENAPLLLLSVLLGVTEARAKVGSIQATPELVNDPAAFAKFQAAPPAVGHGTLVRGTIDEDGVVHANTVMHAKDSPQMWSPDR